RKLRRPDPQRQDALLPDLGADAPIDELRYDVDIADIVESRRRFLRPAQCRGPADPDLRPFDGIHGGHAPALSWEWEPGAPIRSSGERCDELLPASEPRGHADEREQLHLEQPQ